MTRPMLCHGCDTPLGPDRYCAGCEEVMPVYPDPEQPFLHGYHPGRLLAGDETASVRHRKVQSRKAA